MQVGYDNVSIFVRIKYTDVSLFVIEDIHCNVDISSLAMDDPHDQHCDVV